MGKLQDAISSIKGALNSDTGKSLTKGLAATALAGLAGGSAGVGLVGGTIKKIKEIEKERDLEKVRKAKEQLSMDTHQLNYDLLKDKVAKAKEIDKHTYGTITAHDIADDGTDEAMKKDLARTNLDIAKEKLAQLKAGIGVKGSGRSKEGKTDLRIPKAMPIVMTSGAVGDPEKNIDTARIEGAKLGTDIVNSAGIKGIGSDQFKRVRSDLSGEVGRLGLNPYQANTAQRSMSEEAMPGFYDENKRIVDTNAGHKRGWTDLIAEYSGPALGAIGGAATGAFAGSFGGPVGSAVGGIMGAATGFYGMDKVQDALDNIPADIPANAEQKQWGDSLVKGLKASGIYNQEELEEVLAQLVRTQDFQMIPQSSRSSLIKYIKDQFPHTDRGGANMYEGLFGTAAR